MFQSNIFYTVKRSILGSNVVYKNTTYSININYFQNKFNFNDQNTSLKSIIAIISCVIALIITLCIIWKYISDFFKGKNIMVSNNENINTSRNNFNLDSEDNTDSNDNNLILLETEV